MEKIQIGLVIEGRCLNRTGLLDLSQTLELETKSGLDVARGASRSLGKEAVGVGCIDHRTSAARGGVAVQVVGIQQVFSFEKRRQMEPFFDVEVSFDLRILLR